MPKAQEGTQAIDFSGLLKRLEVLLAKAPALVAAMEQLIALLAGFPVPLKARCDPGCDCHEHLDCAVSCQVHALCATIQARDCCDAPPG